MLPDALAQEDVQRGVHIMQGHERARPQGRPTGLPPHPDCPTTEEDLRGPRAKRRTFSVSFSTDGRPAKILPRDDRTGQYDDAIVAKER